MFSPLLVVLCVSLVPFAAAVEKDQIHSTRITLAQCQSHMSVRPALLSLY